MKLKSKKNIIVFLLTLGLSHMTPAYQLHPIAITYSENKTAFELVYKIILEQFYIPESMISVTQKNLPCEPETKTFFQICIKDDGKLELPIYDVDKIKSTYKIFLEGI